MQLGARYYGSPEIQVSQANEELVPDKVSFYKFSFKPFSDCKVSINGSDPILITSELGFTMNEVDAYIGSFIIIDEGINFHWIAGSR